MTLSPKSDPKLDPCICTVEVTPDEVDAGAEITLKARVTGLRRSLSGPFVSVRDQDDAELAHAALKKSDDGDCETDDIVLAAPCTAGEHVYRAVVVANDKDGKPHEQASTEVHLTVQPHAAELNVWNVPSTVVAGARFKFIVGFKCSAGCNLSGRGLSIAQSDGGEIAAANIGAETWPGTDALYFAEVEAEAPQTAGNHQWEVKTATWDSELPHAAGSLDMVVKVVNAPDCEITVAVLDRESQNPIKGARVVMHPYRATTDENGLAKVQVTKGRYDVLVSGSKYVAACIPLNVTSDMIATAELDAEPPLDPLDEV